MNALLNFAANTLTLGVGAVAGMQTTMRAGQNLSPYPLPHQFAALLDHPWRLRYLHPGDILGLFGVYAGATVLDLGCGTGLFTVNAAQMVGEQGHIHAVDVQSAMLDQTRGKVEAANLAERVELHWCGAYDIPLPDDSVDLAIVIATLGEIPDKPAALSELRRVIKPGGRLGIGEELPHPAYLLSSSLRRWTAEAGFRHAGKTGSPFCYQMVFTNEK